LNGIQIFSVNFLRYSLLTVYFLALYFFDTVTVTVDRPLSDLGMVWGVMYTAAKNKLKIARNSLTFVILS
jgi:hypothetical protein